MTHYTKTLLPAKEVLHHLHMAYNGISQTPYQAYLDACLGHLNNGQSGFYPYLQEAVDEYTKDFYDALYELYTDRGWELPWDYDTFHEEVNEGFWELNL